jgi:hypothetical protein
MDLSPLKTYNVSAVPQTITGMGVKGDFLLVIKLGVPKKCIVRTKGKIRLLKTKAFTLGIKGLSYSAVLLGGGESDFFGGRHRSALHKGPTII